MYSLIYVKVSPETKWRRERTLNWNCNLNSNPSHRVKIQKEADDLVSLYKKHGAIEAKAIIQYSIELPTKLTWDFMTS